MRIQQNSYQRISHDGRTAAEQCIGRVVFDALPDWLQRIAVASPTDYRVLRVIACITSGGNRCN